MSKYILIAAGGTGGHIYPAQGLAQQLAREAPHLSILFVAGGLSSNRYFDKTQFRFQEVATGPLLSKHPIKALKGLWKMSKGVWQSLKIMKHHKPSVVVGFGSYYTVPTLIAAKLLRIPIILHEANSIPGKANKWMAPLAQHVGVHFPSTAALLKGSVVEVGMPLREGYHPAQVDQEQAFAYFQLEANLTTLLVFGGSQGARALNHFMKESLPFLKGQQLQVIHLTGEEQTVQDFEQAYALHGVKACVKAFETNMQLAWRAADVFLGRSGASTLAEAMAFGVPGLLIPYPYATDQHQDKNADFLVKTVGGGMKHAESNLTAQVLASLIKQMCQPAVFSQMKQAICLYKQRPERLTLCDLVLKSIEVDNV